MVCVYRSILVDLAKSVAISSHLSHSTRTILFRWQPTLFARVFFFFFPPKAQGHEMKNQAGGR